MPQSNYAKITVNSQNVDVTDIADIPISISYRFEDKEDFQKKRSGDSFSLTVPATLNNDKVNNTFHNPGVEDFTADGVFRKPRKGVIECNSCELLVGKFFLKSASHTDRPQNYVYDCYGDSADWLIDLKEGTFYDFLKQIVFSFTKDLIVASWAFDGTNEALPYVFAPVRYGPKMDTNDDNIIPQYLKPSISVYWLIYFAFKSIGYQVKSDFFNTPYFRRLVMPWTFGSFLYSEGTSQDNLKFNAKNVGRTFIRSSYGGGVDLKVTNDNVLPGYDSNNVYTYDPGSGTALGLMKWTYLPAFSFGPIAATFELTLAGSTTLRASSSSKGQVYWFLNGVEDVSQRKLLFDYSRSGLGKDDYIIDYTLNASFNVSPGDVVTCQVVSNMFGDGISGSANQEFTDVAFTLAYTRYILGSTINFDTFNALKNYNFLDFLRGVTDAFNLIPGTDPVSKVVVFEPAHPFSLNADASNPAGGYFNGRWLDWNKKQDLNKESINNLYSDGEREQLFKFKDDTNDGLLKVAQDRNKTTLGQAKYVLPERFKAGKKEIENRFFSPVMHYDAVQWKSITISPAQLIALIPENISNTSESEAQNTFAPKLAYYGGLRPSTGWRFDGDISSDFPYMYAVDYLPGGENNPVLSYSDEKIGNEVAGYALGVGLMRRFYMQRMAIIRNGQYYDTWLKLNNLDVTNNFHREHKIVRGQKWELLEIKDYKPLKDETTAISLKKWAPILLTDLNNCFPSYNSVINAISTISPFDLNYKTLKALTTDLPK